MVLITIVNGIYKSIYDYGYESIPINTMFSGMNIHFNPAILMWTEGVLLVLTHCQLSTTWYNKKSILRELGCTWWTGVLACNLRILMTNIYIYMYWLVVWNMFYVSIQLGFSWSQLLLTHFFQRGRSTTNQIWMLLGSGLEKTVGSDWIRIPWRIRLVQVNINHW